MSLLEPGGSVRLRSPSGIVIGRVLRDEVRRGEGAIPGSLGQVATRAAHGSPTGDGSASLRRHAAECSSREQFFHRMTARACRDEGDGQRMTIIGSIRPDIHDNRPGHSRRPVRTRRPLPPLRIRCALAADMSGSTREGKTMHAPWLGTRRIAFVPVLDASVDHNPPPDFLDRVAARVYDVDPVTSVDRSLQRYIDTVSYGRARVEAEVLPIVSSPDEHTVDAGLNSLPANHTFDAACVVLLTGGEHRNGFAWWHVEPPTNGFANFARVNLAEGLGIWAMEIMHCLTEFADLYNTDPHLGGFDNMACNCGTHPSVHTKVHLQWLDTTAFTTKVGFGEDIFVLHPVGLPQPPPPGRTMAVRIPARAGNSYYVIEARVRSDPYESRSYASRGSKRGSHRIRSCRQA